MDSGDADDELFFLALLRMSRDPRDPIPTAYHPALNPH